MRKTKTNLRGIALLLGIWACLAAQAGILGGRITDSQTGEPLIGATISAEGTTRGAVADLDGNYRLELPQGTYTLLVQYVGYRDARVAEVSIPAQGETTRDFALEADTQTLGEVQVTATARRNSEVAQLQQQRLSLVVQTGVSAQQIARTQDKDASEVIRRVPGVSVVDEKFVLVRGLSQRYNNVWINGGGVPSSEADSRAFSFDILPSSQLDHMTIVKSPTPEYPADFTGGFILVSTKQLSDDNGLNISIGTSINDRTHFRAFQAAKGSSTDWLGFDGGLRSLQAGMKGALQAYPGYEGGTHPRLSLTDNGLNNDWSVRTRHPAADVKWSADYNHTWHADGGQTVGLLAALNYSNTFRTQTDMENSLYGPYDISNNKTVFLRKATDNQYSHDTRLGGMLNLSFRPKDNRHLLEWKNIFNQLAKDRYAERTGFNAQPDNIHDQEYYFASRTTYNTQLTGKHTADDRQTDWSVGYAYANRNLPDRRLIQRTDRTEQTMGIYRISREFTRLDEHMASAAANYQHTLHADRIDPVLKAGLYGEYRTRQYHTRQFQYGWQPENNLPQGFLFFDDVASSVLIPDNYGPDKLYLYEEVNFLNNYAGRQGLMAAYAAANLPLGSFDLYAGLRYEYTRQTLRMNTRQYEESLHDTHYDYNDLFPSVNLTYRINPKHQLRAAYGRSTNRPEFRELSTSVYYDFDLGSNVMGNADLKAAYIDNLDLRYEWYPASGEQISVALFYKHFRNPIEWTYTVAGGTDLIYSFVNARGADNYGIEVDIRKNLDFIGMKNFSLSFNGAWIKSKVRFVPGTNNVDRPMQGQSPYLVNTGLFYHHADKGWNAALLYNRIGKRIIGVGNRYGTASDGTARNIPNSYEMPRNSIDLSVGKSWKHWEVKATVRDLLAEHVRYKQFETVRIDGQKRTIEETTRDYRPGRTFGINLTYKF